MILRDLAASPRHRPRRTPHWTSSVSRWLTVASCRKLDPFRLPELPGVSHETFHGKRDRSQVSGVRTTDNRTTKRTVLCLLSAPRQRTRDRSRVLLLWRQRSSCPSTASFRRRLVDPLRKLLSYCRQAIAHVGSPENRGLSGWRSTKCRQKTWRSTCSSRSTASSRDRRTA